MSITHPTDGAVWTPGTALILQGSAYDPEEGFLDGASLTWRSDRAGVLGAGATVSLTALEPVDHVITLTARDAGGRQGSASIVVRVPRQTYLPLILHRAGSGAAIPTPTPTVPCTVLFREDFSAAGLPGWTATGGAWTNPGGVMQGASGPGTNAWNIVALPSFDFTYEGTVTLRNGSIAGLAFRSTDGTQGYELFVDVTGGQLVLARRPYTVLGIVRGRHPARPALPAAGGSTRGRHRCLPGRCQAHLRDGCDLQQGQLRGVRLQQHRELRRSRRMRSGSALRTAHRRRQHDRYRRQGRPHLVG